MTSKPSCWLSHGHIEEAEEIATASEMGNGRIAYSTLGPAAEAILQNSNFRVSAECACSSDNVSYTNYGNLVSIDKCKAITGEYKLMYIVLDS